MQLNEPRRWGRQQVSAKQDKRQVDKRGNDVGELDARTGRAKGKAES